MGRRPDFVIVGFPKCGTHALLRALGRHPQIHTHPDEVGFFGRDRMTLDEYERLFDTTARLVGEKTATYVYRPAAIEQMADLIPEAKVIVCLRHPIHMLHSFYNFRVWEFAEGWPPGFDGVAHPFHELVLQGTTLNAFGLGAADYATHLEAGVLQHFDDDSVEYVIQEQMWARPSDALDRIQAFLGADVRPMDVPVVNSRVEGGDRYPNVDYGHRDYPRALEHMIGYFDERRRALIDLVGGPIPEWDRYDRWYEGLVAS